MTKKLTDEEIEELLQLLDRHEQKKASALVITAISGLLAAVGSAIAAIITSIRS